jgi:hypothetical protein
MKMASIAAREGALAEKGTIGRNRIAPASTAGRNSNMLAAMFAPLENPTRWEPAA